MTLLHKMLSSDMPLNIRRCPFVAFHKRIRDSVHKHHNTWNALPPLPLSPSARGRSLRTNNRCQHINAILIIVVIVEMLAAFVQSTYRYGSRLETLDTVVALWICITRFLGQVGFNALRIQTRTERVRLCSSTSELNRLHGKHICGR